MILEHWREHALVSDIRNHVAKRVVAGDAIPCLCAASGIRVDGLRAQRARDFIGEERDAETVHHRCAEVMRTHDGLVAVFLGGHCGHKPARMGLSTPKKARVSWVFGLVEFVHHFTVSLLVDLERSQRCVCVCVCVLFIDYIAELKKITTHK